MLMRYLISCISKYWHYHDYDMTSHIAVISDIQLGSDMLICEMHGSTWSFLSISSIVCTQHTDSCSRLPRLVARDSAALDRIRMSAVHTRHSSLFNLNRLMANFCRVHAMGFAVSAILSTWHHAVAESLSSALVEIRH